MIGLSAIYKGGPGSGNFDHEGRPGEIGGSGEGDVAEKTSIDKIKEIFKEQISIIDENSVTVQKHLDGISKISPEILTKLKDRGVSIYIGKKSFTKLDDNQQWIGVVPKGWPPGSTYDNVAGAYARDTKKLTLGSGLDGSVAMAVHEIGHALLSEKVFDIEASGGTKTLFQLNEKYFNSFTDYYKQGGKGGFPGSHEMFAESLANISVGKNFNNMFIRTASNDIKKSFKEDISKFIKSNGYLA